MRIKPYYCPHCGRYKRSMQVTLTEDGMLICRHCGSSVRRTEYIVRQLIEEDIRRERRGHPSVTEDDTLEPMVERLERDLD